MNPTVPLLLAPAGSMDALKAACAAGADAVYLGGRAFGARQYAANFSDEELEQAVRYVHIRGIQVYVTVNTLITEEEIPLALNYLLFLYRTGVDAVLIQDIGLLSLAHTFIPHLTLHASTQMGVHNIPGALFAAKNGCRRIVLARELTGEEIKTISHSLHENSVDLEVFIHGALCYGYSGRCLLSSLLGGRSGNRGRCAQPCRKEYQLESAARDHWGRIEKSTSDGTRGYLLSTKDLCLYPILPEIVKLPVAALKIEGRMRSPEYVATVISIYRKALDSIRNSSFHSDPEDISDLSIAFSRGFTTGYLSGVSFSEVMGREYPGNQGYIIGTVISSRKGRVQVRLSSPIIPKKSDGLVIRDTHREEGLVLRDNPIVKGDIIELLSPFSPKPGALVSITKRKDLEKRIISLLADPDKRYVGSLHISCSMEFLPDGTISILGAVIDRNSKVHSFAYVSQETVEPAHNQKITRDQLLKQLNKTGGTLFSFSDITISGEEGWFAPVRILNNLRREILHTAEDAIIYSFLPESNTISKIQKQCKTIISENVRIKKPEIHETQVICIVSSAPDAYEALQSRADRVYLLCDVTDVDLSLLQDYSGLTGIMVPGIIRQKDLDIFLEDIRNIIAAGIHHVLVDSPGIGEYLNEKFPEISISGYYGLPVSNSFTVRRCKDFEFCTLSPELSRQEIRSLCLGYNHDEGPDLAVCCQGLIEAAITEDNLCSLSSSCKGKFFAIRDEKKYTFPIYCEKSGRTHILNSSEHSYIDEFSDLRSFGIRKFIIDARGRGTHYAGEMTALWKKMIQHGISGEEWEKIRNQVIGMSYNGITRSGYRRGLSGMK